MSKKSVKINERLVGDDVCPYVIAEVGSNFDQDLDKALCMIDFAADSGANAVKFQLFRADILYPDGGELYEVFKSIELNQGWVPKLAEHAREREIDFMASAFDVHSVKLLEDIGVQAHKVASSETTNLQLLHTIASTGKPVILSTGMCDMADVEAAVQVCREVGNENIILMQCGAVYPLPTEQANLRVITTFADRFGFPTGFSDHTLGALTSVVAVGLGANIFEKHFTLDRNSEGPDHFYAMEPSELKSYISDLHQAYQSLGKPEKTMLSQEKELGRRKGLYFVRDMGKGDLITPDDVIIQRPALGLRDRYFSSVVGGRVVGDKKGGSPINWLDISFTK